MRERKRRGLKQLEKMREEVREGGRKREKDED